MISVDSLLRTGNKTIKVNTTCTKLLGKWSDDHIWRSPPNDNGREYAFEFKGIAWFCQSNFYVFPNVNQAILCKAVFTCLLKKSGGRMRLWVTKYAFNVKLDLLNTICIHLHNTYADHEQINYTPSIYAYGLHLHTHPTHPPLFLHPWAMLDPRTSHLLQRTHPILT